MQRQKIMKGENYRTALERAMAICSKSEKCKNDIRSKLGEWKLTDEKENEAIIGELVAAGFIDERRYARSYTVDKVRFNKWGKIKIRAMLRSRGLSEEDIDHGMDMYDHDQYMQMMEDEIGAKKRTIKSKNIYDLKARLLRFAASRGYEQDHVYDIVRRLLS